MFIIQQQRLDYDDYPVGMPTNQVGPFDSYDEAEKWLGENMPYSAQTDSRRGVLRGYSVQIRNVLAGVTRPEDWGGDV